MVAQFEYGLARVKDLTVQTSVDERGKTHTRHVLLAGRPVEATPRFWNSLHVRFGFTSNIFRYFRHDEVFSRISEVSPNDRLRWCVERSGERERLLGVSNPNSAVIRHDELADLLRQHGAEDVTYDRGVVTSRHTPRAGDTFPIGGDDFQNKYVLDTPIDGFGRPAVYLSLLRLICANGAIGYSPAFRSELSMGRGSDRADFALVRVLEGFNNEEGFAAMRERFESATRSWASVQEVRRLYKVLVKLHHDRQVRRLPKVGWDGASAAESGSPLLRALERKSGDLSEIYGLANVDTLTQKRQRTLPATCKVYDLLNFASEAATHHVEPAGQKLLQAFIGDLISAEFDLEGTADAFSNWQDFFIGHDATTSTLAAMQRR